MRRILFVVPCLMLVGCGSVEYRDTNAAVDAHPACIGVEDDQPGAVVPEWCERTSTATWSTDDEDMPAPDFGDDDGDD